MNFVTSCVGKGVLNLGAAGKSMSSADKGRVRPANWLLLVFVATD
jgi:hypothetical protein